MSSANTADYHRGELKAALDPAHPGHILPPPLPVTCKVLDVGCGAGQTMIAAYPDRVTFGIDVDGAALSLGRSLTGVVHFACSRAEALPFPNRLFGFVVARVSLPYTDMSRSLREIRRVLRPGGQVWMTLHAFSVPWAQAKRSGVKGWILFGYIVLNSALFHLVQRNFPLLGRYESFQTTSGISRALRQAGFTDIVVRRGAHFLVTAAASNK